MKCPVCNSENMENSKYCCRCGAKFTSSSSKENFKVKINYEDDYKDNIPPEHTLQNNTQRVSISKRKAPVANIVFLGILLILIVYILFKVFSFFAGLGDISDKLKEDYNINYTLANNIEKACKDIDINHFSELQNISDWENGKRYIMYISGYSKYILIYEKDNDVKTIYNENGNIIFGEYEEYE